MLWVASHELYLHELCDISKQLSEAHKAHYLMLKERLKRYRIPSIVLGTISGSVSFGTTTFPPLLQRWVSVVVGGTSLTIAIVQAIESYLKISERMSGSLAGSIEYKRLAEDIKLELSLPIEDRSTNGITYVRDAYARWEKITSDAPFLRNMLHIIEKSRINSTASSQVRVISFNEPT